MPRSCSREALRSATSSDVEVPSWRIGLAALAHGMTSDEAYGWLERLKVRRRDVDRIVGAVIRRAEDRRAPPSGGARSRTGLRARDAFAPDAPLLALAREDRPELRDYFSRLRGVSLEIGGADLIAMGLSESPRIGDILGEIRRRKLNGELDGRDAELAAARELASA